MAAPMALSVEYWGPAKALIDWTSEKADNDIIIGNTTDLSGKFRYSPFGGSNPGAADLDVDNLINGLETVATTKEGGFEVNRRSSSSLTRLRMRMAPSPTPSP